MNNISEIVKDFILIRGLKKMIKNNKIIILFLIDY